MTVERMAADHFAEYGAHILRTVGLLDRATAVVYKGSLLQGTGDEHSDLDLVVVCEEPPEPRRKFYFFTGDMLLDVAVYSLSELKGALATGDIATPITHSIIHSRTATPHDQLGTQKLLAEGRRATVKRFLEFLRALATGPSAGVIDFDAAHITHWVAIVKLISHPANFRRFSAVYGAEGSGDLISALSREYLDAIKGDEAALGLEMRGGTTMRLRAASRKSERDDVLEDAAPLPDYRALLYAEMASQRSHTMLGRLAERLSQRYHVQLRGDTLFSLRSSGGGLAYNPAPVEELLGSPLARLARVVYRGKRIREKSQLRSLVKASEDGVYRTQGKRITG